MDSIQTLSCMLLFIEVCLTKTFVDWYDSIAVFSRPALIGALNDMSSTVREP